jgi:type III secretion protein J
MTPTTLPGAGTPRATRRGAFGRLRRLAAVLGACALLAACSGADLYSQLSEKQANELVAALQSAGIVAEKRSADSKVWSVRVARADFARAVDTLRSEGLPRDEFESLGRVFRKEGFVSSPLEERARLIYGLSQELSNTLSTIDGVVVARVHLAVPERDPLADKPRPASASVMVKHRPGVDMSRHIGQIKALVVNSVEGLSYEHVTVSLFPAQESAASAVREAPPARPATALPAGGLAVGLGGVALGAAILFGAMRGSRQWTRWTRWMRRPVR